MVGTDLNGPSHVGAVNRMGDRRTLRKSGGQALRVPRRTWPGSLPEPLRQRFFKNRLEECAEFALLGQIALYALRLFGATRQIRFDLALTLRRELTIHICLQFSFGDGC